HESASEPPFYYVNTGSIHDGHYRPRFPWPELSTEDVTPARTWAESTDTYSSGVPPLSSDPPLVNDRYFEFTEQRLPGLAAVSLRVHRALYVTDRVTYLPDSSG